MLIKNATIYTAVLPEPIQGDILIRDGKIAAVGPNLPAEGEEVYDATGLSAYPGFVEAHCHIGLDGYGIGYEGADYNEHSDPVVPHLRAIDGIEPADPTFAMAARAGVTTVCTGPGSANVLGGTFVAIKTVGDRVDDMIVRDNVAMKCAFGENPKRCYKEKGISTRMSTAAKLREALLRAQQYKEKKDAGKDVAFDMKSEALLPVLEGKMPLKAHAHQANDLFTAIRIAKEFGVNLTLEHCTEGHKVADKLAAEGYPMAVGPSLTHATKFELRNKTFATPGILAKAGGHVCIITDSPVIPQHYLPLCAGLAIQSGMDRHDALRAITLNAAEHIGIADRVGSIEAGKDADIVLARGDVFDVSGQVVQVFIDGKKVDMA
ncbi:MAG: amidohydrolase [Candidatus Spyradocola sp.]|nr:amidohydrolase [Candidatus Spyradocola sp.]